MTKLINDLAMRFPLSAVIKRIKGRLAYRGLLALCLVAICFVGCKKAKYQPDLNLFPNAGDFFPYTRFLNAEGTVVDLKDWRDRSNVVLFVMRGFAGYVCPYCTKQTAEILQSSQEWKKRRAEVFIVYPGPEESIGEFLDSVQEWQNETTKSPPVPDPELNLFSQVTVLMDVEFKAALSLGLTGDPVIPATFVLDDQGMVKYAYAGGSPSDRPEFSKAFEALDAIEKLRKEAPNDAIMK
jgi:peroxiredoxin